MDEYKDKEQGDEEPSRGFLWTGMHVTRFPQARTLPEVDAEIEKVYDKICDGVEAKYNEHGFHPAMVIGLGPTCNFQLDMDQMGRTPDPTGCTFAVLQHLASTYHDLNPQGYIFVLETIKCDDPERMSVLGHELYVTATSRNGYHRVCCMEIDIDCPKKRISNRHAAKYIYEVDSPFADIWKVWNEHEDFGADIKISSDLPPYGLDWDKLMGGN